MATSRMNSSAITDATRPSTLRWATRVDKLFLHVHKSTFHRTIRLSILPDSHDPGPNRFWRNVLVVRREFALMGPHLPPRGRAMSWSGPTGSTSATCNCTRLARSPGLPDLGRGFVFGASLFFEKVRLILDSSCATPPILTGK